jgi:uncharacterized protein involved in exopolysaccharide biosynthesis
VTARDASEQRLAEAMRARARGAGLPGSPGERRTVAAPGAAPRPAPRRLGWALLIALLAGTMLGVALALTTLLAPGMLPTLG